MRLLGRLLRLFFVGFLIGNLFLPVPSASLLQAESLLPKDRKIFDESAPPPPEVSDMEAAIERARFIRYRQDRWNEMRRRLESGEALIPETEKPVPTAERKQLPQPPPVGPGLNVVLPYESGLSISGRKVIDFKLSNTIYAQPDSGKGRINKTDFALDQQLQVRVKGTVGRKVTVNVDFDDTRDDKRDISVVYKGDPDEVLQEAAFGDITISLPSTEFVGYSKSVFGVRAELLFRPRTGFARLFPSALWHRYTPQRIKMFLIGSRTKGITQTKRFTGNFILQRKELNDIAYPRRQFYLLAFATGPAPATEHRPIVQGSERIFVDDQDPNNNNVDETTRTFVTVDQAVDIGGVSATTQTFTGPSGTNTGVFKLLVPGVDYTVDYVKGVVRFKRAIQLRDVIVADYTPVGSNTPLSRSNGLDPAIAPANRSNDLLQGYMPTLLKPDESQFFATRELKSYYNLGDTKIARDDGRGNFILKIIDLDRNEPSQISGLDVSTNTQVKPVPKYPTDIDVDFENGIFSFVSSDTFRSPNPRPFTDDIYIYRDSVPAFKNRYRIFAEYRFKKGNFSLDQTNIVSQSEQVFVDGRRMTRDVDYFIDYDVGIVTFFRPDIIRDDSVVEITYDYSPFGGQGEETLVGMRQEWYVTDNFFLGGSVLMNFAPRASGVPDLRSTSKSITVLEADVNWKNVKFWDFPVQMTQFSAEIAQSIKNPNTADKALVESFEGVKLEDAANLNKDSWQVAANPQRGNPGTAPANGAFAPGYAAAGAGQRGVILSNEDFKITDINPGAIVESSDRVQTLKVDYRLDQQYEAASVVQVLNRAGVDFFTNRRQFMELWIHGDNSGSQVRVRLGGINELADSDTSGALKTEDKDKTGTLSSGEDVGWSFINPDGSTTTVGSGNGRLDTEDLNGDGRLNAEDGLDGNYFNEVGSPENPLREPDGTTHATVNWNGWKIFQVPLNIPTTAQAEWSAIKQVRLTVFNPNTSALTGTLRFGRVAVVGTRIEDPKVDPSTGAVTARAFAENNQDNPGYPSLVSHPSFQELYDLQDTSLKRREQGLAIQYQRTAATSQTTAVSVKETFTRALDFSEHETFKFFLYGDGTGNDFFLRIGNPGSYFEFSTAMTFTGWRLIDLDILDKNRDGQLDRNADRPFGKWTKRVGSPSLRNITEITMGVYVPASATADSQPSKFYVNEIHLTESVKIVGTAYRANTSFSWPNWGTWGASWRDVDRNFQTLTSVGSGVDSKSGSAFLTLNRLKFLPLNTNLSYSETITPQIQTINDPNILVSVLDEGKAIGTSQNLSGNLLMTQLPLLPTSIRGKLLNVDFSADHSLAIRSQADREDETFNYRYGTSYSLPWQPDLLPTRFLTFRPLPTSVSYGFSQTNSYLRLHSENTDTRSVAESYSMQTAFQFFPQMNLGASYGLSRAFEERSQLDLSSGIAPATRDTLGRYNKSLSQSASLSGSLRAFSWLTPAFSYQITTAETNNVNDVLFGTTTFRRGTLKSISRSSNGDVSASIAPKDIFQYIRYVRLINPMINSLSFSGGYGVADGDTYENVDSGFESRDKLTIRGTPLDLTGQNPNARRTSLTATDTSRLSGRWTPFEGFTFLRSRLWAPLKNLSGSGTFTESLTRRDTTGTLSQSYSRVWPDFVFSTSEIEHPLFLKRWMSDTRVNGNYQERLSEVLGQTRSRGNSIGSDLTFTMFKLLQFSIGYTNAVSQEENLQTNQVTSRSRQYGINGQVITTLKWGNWRFTPRYDQSQSEAEDGTGKKTSDLVNRNASLQIFGDINIPRFFRLPFGKQLSLTNRLILTSSILYGMVRDGVDETKSRDNVDFNANGDFEVTPNIRVAFGGGYSRTMHKVKKEEDVQSFSFSSRITIQF